MDLFTGEDHCKVKDITNFEKQKNFNVTLLAVVRLDTLC